MGRFSPFVLVFLLFVASSSYEAKVVEVNVICKETQNPSFCSSLLNSRPCGTGADLVSLAQYTIDVVRSNVTNSITLIKSLIAQSANDSKASAHYKLCLEFFSSDACALGSVEDTEKRLKEGDYQGVNLGASAVWTSVDSCISGDAPSPSEPPYPDHSLLPKYASVIEQVVQIILSISILLLHN
ncbi:Pectinesterase inhibitor domain [Sesbania bispinosa]|nr:Pectinesterase inhibitor domain [Sesbania bispinosa]